MHKTTPRILKSELTPRSVHEQLWKTLLKKRSSNLIYQNKTSDGKLVDVSSNIDPILDDKNNITGFLCIQRDISERLRYEKLQQIVVHIANAAHTAENLHELFDFIKEELSQVLKTDNLMIAFYDKEKQKLTLPFINESENQKEIKETDFKKTFSAQVIKAEKPLLFRSDEIKQMIQSGKVKLVGTLSKVWLGVPLKVENKITGLLVLQDYEDEGAFNESDLNMLDFVAKQISISIERLKIRKALQQKENELLAQNEALIIAKERAEESDQLKSEFLLNMSHEVRTPLNAILGFSSLMQDEDLSKADRNNYVRIVINSSQQLLNIIEEILEISRLQTHELRPDEKAFKLNQLMLELFADYDQSAREKGIPFYLKKGLDDDESELIADRSGLKTILKKLLDNAFKYTTSGHVELGYSVEDDQLILFVKDTGIGIRPENQEIIFKSFSQEEKELTEKTGGLGLGLSIAREYARLLQGDISLESEKDKGSSFYVKIPFHPVKPVTGDKRLINLHEEGPLVLVVEDDEVNYQYLEILLKHFRKKIHLYHVFTGEDAVTFCKTHPGLQLVLMDIKLPEMSGLDAARLIKERCPDLPIVAQTAYSQEIDKKAAREAGCDDFITKPINKDEFYEIMARYLAEE